VQLALKFRNMLPNVVREELDGLVAVISAFFAVEHNPDGTHGNITATSITIGGLPVTPGSSGALPTTTKGDLIAHNGSLNVRVPVGSIGRVLTADPSAGSGLSWQIPATLPGLTRIITFSIDGGGTVPTTGVKADVTVPYGGTITNWTLLADQVGSVVIDIWKDSYANYPPIVGDTITGTTKPTLSSAQKASNAPSGDWNATIVAGDTLRFTIVSISSVTRLNLTLTVAT
jgi:hypothetical protein